MLATGDALATIATIAIRGKIHVSNDLAFHLMATALRPKLSESKSVEFTVSNLGIS